MLCLSFLRDIKEVKKIILKSDTNYQSNSTNKTADLQIKKKKFAKTNSLKQSFLLFISQIIFLSLFSLSSLSSFLSIFLSLPFFLSFTLTLYPLYPSISHSLSFSFSRCVCVCVCVCLSLSLPLSL